MSIAERFLLYMSRSVRKEDYYTGGSDWTITNALSLFTKEYPNFPNLVSGKYIVDFGCGSGYQSVALVKNYNCFVVGIDINKKALQNATKLAKAENISDQKLSFKNHITEDMIGKFDVVICQNSMEHFTDPEGTLKQMTNLIRKSGKVLITFGPPWLAPYGSHMYFFCKVPWLNILFSEKTVMTVRGCFRNDGIKRYQDALLNKITVGKFEKIISANELETEYEKYTCIKGINCLAKASFLREFFINHITVILKLRKER